MNKKRVAIVFTDNSNSKLQNDLTDDLYSIFKELIEIDIIFLSKLNLKEKIIADAILILRPSIVSLIKDRVDDLSKVLIITRSIPKKSIYEMLNIPKGTNVLVVNDSVETVNDTISMFYKLNITHLNFIPYNTNISNLNNIPLVITPGESQLVPSDISKILDIGNRKLDIETFLNLFTILDIKDIVIKKRMFEYINQNTVLSSFGKKQYLKNYTIEEALHQIINVIKSGFIITDYSYNIEFSNDIINKIIGINLINYTHLSNYFSVDDFQKLVKYTTSNTFFLLDTLKIMVKVIAIEGNKEVTGWCFIFEKIKNVSPQSVLVDKFKHGGFIARYKFEDIVYKCDKMRNIIQYSKKISQTDYPILITGETGTGKEILAQSIHNESLRKEEPFIAINCSALPEALLESELFGYEDGAFTGAKKGGKIGIFERAIGGTIFLDELCEMPLRMQVKLLRVLQERQIMRIGGTNLINIDIRVIAATNKQIDEKVKKFEFREDLYYRINTFKINLPSLKERKEDIIFIFKNMINYFENLPENIEKKLLNHTWNGNIRELKNIADYYLVMGNLDILNNDNNTLLKKDDSDLKYKILQVIAKRERQMLANGRVSILKELENEKILISHNRLEKIIEKLQELGLIIRKKGRAGIILTGEGKKISLKE